MRLDTHQHYWELANAFTDWPTPHLAAIYRDFAPGDVEPILTEAGIDGAILVQASPSIAETEYCLSLAAKTAFVKGVVGWIDFEAPDALEQLNGLASHPLLKGLRPMVQSIEEPDWLLREAFAPVFEAMVDHGLVFDGLVRAHQIGVLGALAQRHPDLLILLDHAGKPPIAEGNFDGWAQAIASLAANANVSCKLSGLWTEAGGDMSPETIRPWVDHLLESFGSQRLVWGSDWPVLELAGSYLGWLNQCEDLLAHLEDSQRAAIFGGNGKQIYGVE
jgi:L-fuconolactonase